MKTHSPHALSANRVLFTEESSHLYLYCITEATTTDFTCNTSLGGLIQGYTDTKKPEKLVTLKLADGNMSKAENWSLATFII